MYLFKVDFDTIRKGQEIRFNPAPPLAVIFLYWCNLNTYQNKMICKERGEYLTKLLKPKCNTISEFVLIKCKWYLKA